MTGKERAGWRAKANSLEPLFQLGKGGISDAFIEQVEGAFNTRELIKFKVLLETSPVTPREAANEVAERTGAEVIQVIGGVIVIYRCNPELHKDEKKKNIKAKAKAKKMTRFGYEKPSAPKKKAVKMEKQRKAAAERKAARNAK